MGLYKYILFNGLTHNMHSYFAICIVFFQALKGKGKIKTMRKMSMLIIMLNHGIRDL